MNNRLTEGTGYTQSVAVTTPTSPLSGWPVRLGPFTGVAATSIAGTGPSTGQPTGDCSVDFGPGTYNILVNAVNDAGNVAVAIGDALYYHDGDTGTASEPFLSKKSSGYFFGIALAAITSGTTGSRIAVQHMPPNIPGLSSIKGYFTVAVLTNGTTAVNVFSAYGAPCAFTVTSVKTISQDTTAANITLTEATNTVVTIAKGASAGLVTGGTGLANTSVAAGAVFTVVSSSAGNAIVEICFQVS